MQESLFCALTIRCAENNIHQQKLVVKKQYPQPAASTPALHHLPNSSQQGIIYLEHKPKPRRTQTKPKDKSTSCSGYQPARPPFIRLSTRPLTTSP